MAAPVNRLFGIELSPYSVKVRSSLDMSNVQYVYVVTNLLRQEQEELEQAVLLEDE